MSKLRHRSVVTILYVPEGSNCQIIQDLIVQVRIVSGTHLQAFSGAANVGTSCADPNSLILQRHYGPI